MSDFQSRKAAQRSLLLQTRARALRSAPTRSEEMLWLALRSGIAGASFRRQVPLLGFVVDFLAPRLRLIIEVDGGYHVLRTTADDRRDAKLARAGYLVLRLSHELVVNDLPAAVAFVRSAVAALAP